MKLEITERGFGRINFEDANNESCSLQKSSSADSKIWLGVNDVKIQILRPEFKKVREEFEKNVDTFLKDCDGSFLGWSKLTLPKEFFIPSRMHLNRNQVKELLPFLMRFAATGQIHNNDNDPYLREYLFHEERKYKPNYGDDRECVCGHSYIRHFDPYDEMAAVGCKYCGCVSFKEKVKGEENEEEE